MDSNIKFGLAFHGGHGVNVSEARLYSDDLTSSTVNSGEDRLWRWLLRSWRDFDSPERS